MLFTVVCGVAENIQKLLMWYFCKFSLVNYCWTFKCLLQLLLLFFVHHCLPSQMKCYSSFLKLIVLVSVGLIIFLVADTVLQKAVLLGTQQYFTCCWAQIQGHFSFLCCHDSEGLGIIRRWEMAQPAQLTSLAKAQGTGVTENVAQKALLCNAYALIDWEHELWSCTSLCHASCMCLYPQEDLL